MPIINILEKSFFEHYGECLEEDQLHEILELYGLECDGTIVENGSVSYRVEVPANRPDLLSVEGIAECLAVFTGKRNPPVYELSTKIPTVKLKIKDTVNSIRPYCFGAVLLNINLSITEYQSFINLQEKLSFTVGKKRALVAIGTHDLDTVKSPFVYEALDPLSINFVPLNMKKCCNGFEVLSELKAHPQLKAYVGLLENQPHLPIIRDSNGVILSLAPLINGEHTKIVPGKTRNIFIEVTATDFTKGEIVLNTICTAFSRYCGTCIKTENNTDIYKIEPVCVEYESNRSLNKSYHPKSSKLIFPRLEKRRIELSISYAKDLIGDNSLNAKQVCELLKRMMITCIQDDANPDQLLSLCPVTRSDIMHQCDLVEDIATALGYDTIPSIKCHSVNELSWNKLADYLRSEFAYQGCEEIINWGMCSKSDIYAKLLQLGSYEDLDNEPTSLSHRYKMIRKPIELENPKILDLELVRPTLIVGLLKAMNANQAEKLPLKIFEVGLCATETDYNETFAKTELRCALIYGGINSGLEEVHGILDIILEKLGLIATYSPKFSQDHTDQKFYKLNECLNNPTFLDKRCVKICLIPDNIEIGVMGIVHPNVLKNFKINFPCSLFELSLEWKQQPLSAQKGH